MAIRKHAIRIGHDNSSGPHSRLRVWVRVGGKLLYGSSKQRWTYAYATIGSAKIKRTAIKGNPAHLPPQGCADGAELEVFHDTSDFPLEKFLYSCHLLSFGMSSACAT